jgi:hypothetical protein
MVLPREGLAVETTGLNVTLALAGCVPVVVAAATGWVVVAAAATGTSPSACGTIYRSYIKRSSF